MRVIFHLQLKDEFPEVQLLSRMCAPMTDFAELLSLEEIVPVVTGTGVWELCVFYGALWF